METKRRYSDFESLRMVLARLHPIFIVPPIPEKHSLRKWQKVKRASPLTCFIVEYAILQNRAKSDVTTIEKRKRMLQSFLNQVAKHPYLGHNHLFHQFLDPNVVWVSIVLIEAKRNVTKQPRLFGWMILNRRTYYDRHRSQPSLNNNLYIL
jgi:sorting nexin-4